MKKILKKSQAFYITKFFYYFLLILPVVVYLVGLKMLIGDFQLKINEDSYEIKSLLLLQPPERINTITKEENTVKKTIEATEGVIDLFSSKEKNNFMLVCEIESDSINCDYKFVR
jgi:hypothetical protein